MRRLLRKYCTRREQQIILIQGPGGNLGNGLQGERRHLVCGLHYGRDDQVDLIDEEDDEQEDDDDVGDDNVEDLA